MAKNVHQNLPAMPQMQMPQLQMPFSKESTMAATWERISIPPVPRSSHSIDIVSGSAYIFGGETDDPVDNDMHVVTLPWSSAGADYYKVKAAAAQQEEKPVPSKSEPTEEDPDLDDVPLTREGTKEDKGKGKAEPERDHVPSARIGHATASIGTRIFFFGGRSGNDDSLLEEAGRVWVFDTRSNNWSFLDPIPAVKGGAIVPHPAARSSHCATATDRPRDFAQAKARQPMNWRQRVMGDISKTGIPQDPVVGHVAEDAVDEEAEGYGTFFVHGGILASGDRTNDIWAFDVRARTWTELPAAPGPARGGSAICISKSRLFRFGGHDGEQEIGGQLDFIQLEVETFDDKVSKGEVALRARGGWQSIIQNNTDASTNEIPIEPVHQWPLPRSDFSFHAITIGGGSEYLVLAMGSSSSALQSDVWTFQVPPLGMSTTSVTHAVLQAVGRKTGEGKWMRVETRPYDDDNSADMPVPRAWLASAVMADSEESAIMIWGGEGDDEERLGDGWILRLG